MQAAIPLLVGELCIDFTIAKAPEPAKMRLGGIAHAARGLWAYGVEYAAAVICPAYLVPEAEQFLRLHGCKEFSCIADVTGAPNVHVIGDARETGHQGYENLLRETKKVSPLNFTEKLNQYQNVIIFPGSFDLAQLALTLAKDASITIDIAYDIQSFEDLRCLEGRIETIVTSTSSNLFKLVADHDTSNLISKSRGLGADYVLLKENRGGSRLFDLSDGSSIEVPAILGGTVNSVGVGDTFTAVYAAARKDPKEAVWRGMQVATQYAQTTFPDDLKRDVVRDTKLPLPVVQSLGGINLPWHERLGMQIYLAAPDFTYINKPEVDEAVAALEYHNFRVRRPVVENGEAEKTSDKRALQNFYDRDVELLKGCSLVFAIPLQRDPGTLVEIGMAVALGIPVVTFDPRNENENTMVVCGSHTYSNDLDECLNGTFETLSVLRQNRP